MPLVPFCFGRSSLKRGVLRLFEPLFAGKSELDIQDYATGKMLSDNVMNE
jgi:hypothetical protein